MFNRNYCSNCSADLDVQQHSAAGVMSPQMGGFPNIGVPPNHPISNGIFICRYHPAIGGTNHGFGTPPTGSPRSDQQLRLRLFISRGGWSDRGCGWLGHVSFLAQQQQKPGRFSHKKKLPRRCVPENRFRMGTSSNICK